MTIECGSVPWAAIQLDETVELRPLLSTDAPQLLETVSTHRTDLDPWLRWSGRVHSVEDAKSFLEEASAARGCHWGVFDNGVMVGGVVCWYVNQASRNAEVGYWLITSARGRGLATRATEAVINHLFTERALHRVELQCAVHNAPSRALAERLGCVLEGVRRQSHWLTTRFVDHAVYGALEPEWRAQHVSERD